MSQSTSNNFLDEDSFFTEMLSSQSDLENQIQSLKEIVISDKSIEDKLEELQNFLSSNNIRNATIDILDEKIFDAVLTDAQKLYFEVIKNIDEILRNKQNDAVDRIKSQLNIFQNLLKCWDLCMNHINALEKVSIIDIRNFTVNLFEIMIHMLNHCKTSGQNYGEYFQSVGELLASIFRQCVNTLNLFYSLLDSKISVDTSQDSEMKFVLSIIDETGKIATLTSGMDAKTLSDMWKRFGKLSTNYNLQMKNISSNTVTNHFKGLSENIIEMLSSISQKKQKSLNERSILCSRVLFKILEKLCETYCGWIRNDVMLGIVAMCAHMYQFSEPCLKAVGYNADFIKFVQTNLIFMIEPFLDVIFKNDSFKVAFFECDKTITDSIIGYHLLSLTIMKKISTLPYEHLREWCSKENHITDVCFRNIDKLSKDICVGQIQMQMSRNIAQGSYLTNIYEATCLSIFTLVCQISSVDINEFVELLLKHLLSGKFFNSLLSCDVWCFICRLCSSEMCYSHFKYLMQVYQMLADRKNNVNVVMLSSLLSRQYTFLSDKDKVDFINSIKKDSCSQGWYSIAHVVNEEKKKVLQEQINVLDVNNRISSVLKNLEEQSTIKHLCSLTNDLSIIEASGVCQDDQSTDNFMKMWNKIVCTLGDCEGMSSVLLENLAISLLHATRPQQGQVKYTTSVLESLASLYPFATNGLRLEICRFLHRCAGYLTEANSNAVSELFCRLLSDNEPFVQQQAFECFEHLTHVCLDANLLSSVALRIRNAQTEISKTLPAYISGEIVYRLGGFSNLNDYFQALYEAREAKKHVCRKRSPTVEREEKLPRLEEKAEDSSKDQQADLEKIVDRVCTDVEVLIRFRGQLGRDSCDRLHHVFQDFLEK